MLIQYGFNLVTSYRSAMFLIEMEVFPYSALPLRHVRLLTIEPGVFPPSGTLHTTALEEAAEFDALSYAWGQPCQSYDFSCCGKVLRVQENLYKFFCRVSRSGHSRPIWIDAICINQGEDVEKTHQLPSMRDIYKNANCVLVWLGKNTDVEDEAFSAIPTIAEKLDKTPATDELFQKSHFFVSMGLPLPSSPIWRNIGVILHRSWFGRLGWCRRWPRLDASGFFVAAEMSRGSRFIDLFLLCLGMG